MHPRLVASLLSSFLMFLALSAIAQVPSGDAIFGVQQAALDAAVAKVKPALVRIHVVETYYSEGRELKYEASGSGVVITPEGHVVTNHHVAGHAKVIKCSFDDKSEVDAILVGTDALTDIAVLLLKPAEPRTFAVAEWGDSDAIEVGDPVLAMGSPQAISQSVTQGIISNTEMILPDWMERWGGMELDGENVGALVRWIAHDADIYGGNSGGPMVDMSGKIVGINEISIGLSGAIPGNLARSVSEQIIATGEVRRAWIGVDIQPRLKYAVDADGALVASVMSGSPGAAAGIQPGDVITSIGGEAVSVKFGEEVPGFNLMVNRLSVDKPVEVALRRNGAEQKLMVTPVLREPQQPKEYEIKEWGVTVRNISRMMAKEMKRDSTEGVLITSVRPGGPAGNSKPALSQKDIIIGVGDEDVKNVEDIQRVTLEIVGDTKTPIPTLTRFERKTGEFVTVVQVGLQEESDPGLEVKKAWLPVETQVLTQDIAGQLGNEELQGFRITRVFKGSTAEKAELKVGDLILAVDGEALTASAPEHYEELDARIRQFEVGTSIALKVLRDGAEMDIPVELVRAPLLEREMKRYRDDDFEVTVREVTFFDKSTERWADDVVGVLVHQVTPGGWAALGGLGDGDLVLEVGGKPTPDIKATREALESVRETKAKAVVFKVLRGIHTRYLEIEPKW
jgi:serine protease Do